jgi:hypothetical protein
VTPQEYVATFKDAYKVSTYEEAKKRVKEKFSEELNRKIEKGLNPDGLKAFYVITVQSLKDHRKNRFLFSKLGEHVWTSASGSCLDAISEFAIEKAQEAFKALKKLDELTPDEIHLATRDIDQELTATAKDKEKDAILSLVSADPQVKLMLKGVLNDVNLKEQAMSILQDLKQKALEDGRVVDEINDNMARGTAAVFALAGGMICTWYGPAFLAWGVESIFAYAYGIFIGPVPATYSLAYIFVYKPMLMNAIHITMAYSRSTCGIAGAAIGGAVPLVVRTQARFFGRHAINQLIGVRQLIGSLYQSTYELALNSMKSRPLEINAPIEMEDKGTGDKVTSKEAIISFVEDNNSDFVYVNASSSSGPRFRMAEPVGCEDDDSVPVDRHPLFD